LNNTNQQQIHLELIDGNWQQANSKKMNFNYWLVMIVFSLVFLGSFIVFKKRFKKAVK
jgi:type II secretory pathway component PulL